MEKILSTIYHDSSKNFISNPYPKLKEEIEIKIRMIKNEKVTGVFIRYRKLGEEVIQKMEISYEKNNLVYYKARVICHEEIFSYYFNITTNDAIYYYNQEGISDYRIYNSSNFKILVGYNAPEWMNNTVFYQIMADRFRNGKPEITIKEGAYTYQGFKPINMDWEQIPYEWDKSHCMDFYGGDFYGVIEKLDYLQELGVNAIYFNPIFTSPTMHKYDALDYFEIDHSLGGEEGFAMLCDEMHKRNMKVVLDISINHTSSSSKWFNMDGTFYDKSIGAYNNPYSKEREYYFINEDGSYEAWAGVKTMPSLNYNSQSLRDIIYRSEKSVLKKYLKAPFNIDGWRFDVADVMARNEKVNVYEEVWTEINKEIKSVNKNALILAEEWQDAPEMYNGHKWDSTMNYFSSTLPIREFAGEKEVFNARNKDLAAIEYKFNAKQLKNRLTQTFKILPSQIQYQMFNLIDSHDITRLYNNPKVEFDVYKGSVITLFGLPGAVNVYYGDEKYLDGEMHSIEGARYPMDWSEKLPAKKQEIFEMYKTLSHLKTENEAFGFGGFKVVYAEGDVFAFSRFTEDEAYIFIWSKSSKEETINVDLSFFGLFDNAEFILGDGNLNIDIDKLTIEFAPKMSSLIKII
ncbi:glycoside hydrolase family 13 protein [Helcococcus bovis]|uniref:glycoside hydrolase family 13 protein n=2 Tax=Helcococcus bovis TaxID=3153252 RepID=UPI0038BBD882